MSTHHCAYIALIGAPNAGKSTLLNSLIGSKLSIVSPKVQTTRTIINGICMEGDAQLIFIDTPGIFHNPERQLEKAMVKAAWQGINEAHFIALLVDAKRGISSETKTIIDTLKQQERKVVAIINKIDTVPHSSLLELATQLNNHGIFTNIFMISALNGDGVEDVRKFFAKNAPQGPWMFEEDQISDAPMQFLASEITREKLFMALQQELPYSLSVETEQWERQKNNSIKIHQVIYVMRESQKKIVLGKQGELIKRISMQSRREIETFLEAKVHLFLFVKVRENWVDSPERFENMRLEFPKK